MRRPKLGNFLPPPKLRPFLNMRHQSLVVLDIGCGNRSPSVTKYWLPNCQYFGVDRGKYNNPDSEYEQMDGFFAVDLDESDLSMIPAATFDVIIMAHVIEHLHRGEEVISRLASKLCPNGRIYVEFPSERSARLPSGIDCLNFYDDPTHVRLYKVKEVKAACQSSGLTVIASGTRHDPRWVVADLIWLPLQLWSLIRYRRLNGPFLWVFWGVCELCHCHEHKTTSRLSGHSLAIS